MAANNYIKSDYPKEEIISSLKWLLQGTIQNLHPSKQEWDYYKRVSTLIQSMETDQSTYDNFVNSVKKDNLFIEAPSFTSVNIKNLNQNSIPYEERVLLKRETLLYMKDKLKLNLPFMPTDIYLKDVFVVPEYIQKLHKLASHLVTSRDLGPVKYLTGAPLRGKAVGGGSRLGQMEIEAMLTHGVEKVTRELLTVKSDYAAGKQAMMMEIIDTGKYHFPEKNEIIGGTKKITSTILKAIKQD